MTLVKTNIAGFKKNEKTNVLINENISIDAVKARRQAFKQQKSIERRVEELEFRLKSLEKWVWERKV